MPSRVSISVLNMMDLMPGRPGGGNVGFAVDKRLILSVSYADSEHCTVLLPASLPPQRVAGLKSLIINAAQQWADIGGACEQFIFELKSPIEEHIGLGSHSLLTSAVYFAMDWLYGMPLCESNLLRFITDHYFEPVGDRLQPGFTTGLAPFLGLHGGFAVIESDQHVSFRSHLPSWSVVVILPSDVLPKTFGPREFENTMSAGKRLDQRDAARKAAIVTEELIPALRSGDLTHFGESVTALQSIGSKKAEIAMYGQLFAQQLAELRRLPVECVILSAAGPSIILVSDKPSSSFLHLIGPHFVVLHQGTIDNHGISVHSRS